MSHPGLAFLLSSHPAGCVPAAGQAPLSCFSSSGKGLQEFLVLCPSPFSPLSPLLLCPFLWGQGQISACAVCRQLCVHTGLCCLKKGVFPSGRPLYSRGCSSAGTPGRVGVQTRREGCRGPLCLPRDLPCVSQGGDAAAPCPRRSRLNASAGFPRDRGCGQCDCHPQGANTAPGWARLAKSTDRIWLSWKWL